MEGRNTGIFIAILMVCFVTFFINRQGVAANVSIAEFDFISTNNKSNNYRLSDGISKDEHEEIAKQQLLEYKQKKIKENCIKQAHLDTLESQIRALIGNNINKVGMVYYDINSSKSIRINEDKQFVAASTIKVPINMLMYDMVKENKININEKLKFEQCDYEEGAGILQGTDLSSPISIKTLSDYSIRYSDNIAINMILRKVGIENKYDYMQEMLGHKVDHSGNNTTPKDSWKILEKLYFNVDNNKYYDTMIQAMKKTDYHDRIDKYIPKEIVAHKIGDYGEYVNDIAIVNKKNPYILVVFTEDVPEANEVIAKVSKLIYDAQE
ncbi:serine hydrolase [Clostridium sp.]|uniref:serine hydrolase n=1 Tax=Clostridium sp. TaxID=1506 RepID=UPI003D6D8A03